MTDNGTADGTATLVAKARFFDAWSAWYDVLFPSVVYQAIHLRLLEYIELPDSPTVLDLGCGTGKLLDRLAQQFPTLHGIGVDLSPAMIAQAQAQNPHPDRVEFRQGRSDRLPLDANCVDVVTSTISMAHYLDLPAALAELRRVVRSDGAIYWVDIVPGCGQTGQVRLPITPGGFYLYSAGERERLGAAAGFSQAQHHYLLGWVMLTILR